MRALASIGRELLGLFVDDGGVAIAVLGWIGVSWLLSRAIPEPWPPLILVAGLAVILVASVARAGRRRA